MIFDFFGISLRKCSLTFLHTSANLSLHPLPNRLVDNLPCATRFQLMDSKDEQLDRGYRLGSTSEDESETFINNHLRLVLYYHTEDK